MALVDLFNNITKEYDDKLFAIFKDVIDKAIIEAEEKKLNSLDKFLYIDEMLNHAYIDLASSMEIASSPNYIQRINPPISEKLLERICNYLEPYVNAASDYIKVVGEQVINSTNMEELLDNYSELQKILETDGVFENSYLYEGIEFDNHDKKYIKR